MNYPVVESVGYVDVDNVDNVILGHGNLPKHMYNKIAMQRRKKTR